MRWFFYAIITGMKIKKRLSMAQQKRHALLNAGITPSAYGQRKASIPMTSVKQKSRTRKLKHRHRVVE
jgi:hypothetical protein